MEIPKGVIALPAGYAERWKRFIRAIRWFGRNATAHMAKNYEIITGNQLPSDGICYHTPNTKCHNATQTILWHAYGALYLYQYNNMILLSGTLQLYPIERDDLWPWTVLDLPIPDFPLDVFTVIARYLEVPDLLNCAQVSKKWREMADSDIIWTERVLWQSQCIWRYEQDSSCHQSYKRKVKRAREHYGTAKAVVMRIPRPPVRGSRTRTLVAWLRRRSPSCVLAIFRVYLSKFISCRVTPIVIATNEPHPRGWMPNIQLSTIFNVTYDDGTTIEEKHEILFSAGDGFVGAVRVSVTGGQSWFVPITPIIENYINVSYHLTEQPQMVYFDLERAAQNGSMLAAAVQEAIQKKHTTPQ